MSTTEPYDDGSGDMPARPLRGRDIFGTERELADFVAHRTIIDQAKGMLMYVYDIDANKAFELLKWRSQVTNVKLRLISQQLLEDLPKLGRNAFSDIESACDQVLLTVHERIAPPSER
jgi:hypothetical protein